MPFKLFFKVVRPVLGAIILFFDKLFSPKPVPRAPQAQALLDQRTAGFSLYQFEACPFCVKVRRAIRRLGLKIELRDAKTVRYGDELLREGGQSQVPCLRIPQSGGGKPQWLYESSDIIAYLEKLA